MNFVQPWPRHVRMLRHALLAAGLLSLGLVSYQYRQLDGRSTALAWQLQDAQSSVPASSAARDFTDAQAAGTNEQAVRHAGEVLQRLDLPWQALFNSLERAIADDIVILSLLPNAEGEALVLTALAADADAAIDFAERLKASGLLTDIHLAQEEPVEENPRFPLQFSINAGWNATGAAAKRTAS